MLIVSALYGLVKLNEGIKEYELTMTDRLVNGMKVYRFWQREGLWEILLEYIKENGINCVWSLLPSSRYPYHQVFEELWRTLERTSVRCVHVKVSGSAAGIKLAEWLKHMVENPHLVQSTQAGSNFQYVSC